MKVDFRYVCLPSFGKLGDYLDSGDFIMVFEMNFLPLGYSVLISELH